MEDGAFQGRGNMVLGEHRARGQEHRIRTLNDKLKSEYLIRRARGNH